MSQELDAQTLHVSVYHPVPAKRQSFVDALRQHLPNTAIVDDVVGTDTRYLVAWMPPASAFAAAPAVKACFSLGAGVDHLLASGALPATIPLFRLEDAGMGDQMARYCRHEVEHFRLLNWRYALQQQQCEWEEHEPPEPNQVRVGLFGYGVLGRQVAAMLVHDGYQVSAYRRSAASNDGSVSVFGGSAQLARFLSGIDVLILIAPSTPDTRDAINRQTLEQLPAGAWLINVARGDLVVEQDLLAAIDSGHMAGASLDVFREEPLPENHPFWGHNRIRITPHVAALTRVDESARQIARQITAFAAGARPSGLVSRDHGY